jgi:iron complex transport system substrate-binding protein
MFLQWCALFSLVGITRGVRASSLPAPRLVVLDWGLVETLLALGVIPTGVAEIDGYHDNVVEPRVPAQVADVGLRLAPNLEWLQQLSPDYILINSSQESQREILERIARCVHSPFTATREPPGNTPSRPPASWACYVTVRPPPNN